MVFSSFTCFFFFCSSAAIIDNSNNASMPTHEDVMETSTISQALNKVNPFYATILGQPLVINSNDKTKHLLILLVPTDTTPQLP